MSTVDAFVEIVKNLGPVATGVGGALATLWRTTHRIFRRLREIEEDIKKIRQRLAQIMEQANSLGARVESLESSMRVLDVGLREFGRNLDKVRTTSSGFMTHAGHAKTLERISSLERQSSDLDTELDRIDRTLVNFAREQNDQWQTVNRSLGQLEGYIKGRTSVVDD